jgi:hypothetical protein
MYYQPYTFSYWQGAVVVIAEIPADSKKKIDARAVFAHISGPLGGWELHGDYGTAHHPVPVQEAASGSSPSVSMDTEDVTNEIDGSVRSCSNPGNNPLFLSVSVAPRARMSWARLSLVRLTLHQGTPLRGSLVPHTPMCDCVQHRPEVSEERKSTRAGRSEKTLLPCLLLPHLHLTPLLLVRPPPLPPPPQERGGVRWLMRE